MSRTGWALYIVAVVIVSAGSSIIDGHSFGPAWWLGSTAVVLAGIGGVLVGAK